MARKKDLIEITITTSGLPEKVLANGFKATYYERGVDQKIEGATNGQNLITLCVPKPKRGATVIINDNLDYPQVQGRFTARAFIGAPQVDQAVEFQFDSRTARVDGENAEPAANPVIVQLVPVVDLEIRMIDSEGKSIKEGWEAKFAIHDGYPVGYVEAEKGEVNFRGVYGSNITLHVIVRDTNKDGDDIKELLFFTVHSRLDQDRKFTFQLGDAKRPVGFVPPVDVTVQFIDEKDQPIDSFETIYGYHGNDRNSGWQKAEKGEYIFKSIYASTGRPWVYLRYKNDQDQYVQMEKDPGPGAFLENRTVVFTKSPSV